MKKLLSILLALVLLAGLCVSSLAASEPEVITGEPEAVEEPEPAEAEPVSEELSGEPDAEPEEPGEEPGEEPAEEPAPDAEEPGTDEASEEPAAAEPVAEEPGPAEITFIPDGKSGNGKALQLTAGDIAGAQQSNVYFGNYRQSGSRKEPPIKWRVLENANGKLFLLSDQNLDVYWYHKTPADITWADSDIRGWLNDTVNGFAGDAFSAGELAAIPQTDVVNDDNPEYGTAGGENTKDQVFLLSIAEATNTAYGFTDNYDATDTRKAMSTAYVGSGGKTGTNYMNGAGNTDWWWLRSPA